MIWPKYANQDQENPMEFKDGRTKVNLDKKTQKTSIWISILIDFQQKLHRTL